MDIIELHKVNKREMQSVIKRKLQNEVEVIRVDKENEIWKWSVDVKIRFAGQRETTSTSGEGAR